MGHRSLTIAVRAVAVAGVAAGTAAMCLVSGAPTIAPGASVHALSQPRHDAPAAASPSTAAYHVMLTVDGDVHQIVTTAATVSQLLAQQGVSYGQYDVIAPAGPTQLTDGAEVVVRHARPLTVTVDGTTTVVWTDQRTVGDALDSIGLSSDKATSEVSRSRTIPADGLSVEVSTEKTINLVVDGEQSVLRTAQPNVGSALAEAGVILGTHDAVNPDISTAITTGMTVTVQRARAVSVTADGRTSTVSTTAMTVGDVLSAAGITLGPDDSVSAPLGAPVTDGMEIVIVRVTTKTITVKTAIPHGTRKISDSSMYVGDSKVVTAGSDGTTTTVYSVTYHDGVEVSRTKVSSSTVPPVTRVVKVGTKPPPRTTNTPADKLNWPALAQCESSGDPTLVDKPFYGLYQFDLPTWQWMGGTGLPSDASPAEQLARAEKLYNIMGSHPWPVCGHHLYDP